MIAFDANVPIYSCDRADPIRQRRAFDLVAAAHDGILLWQVAVEFVAASRKLSPQGFTSEHAWARLHEFMDLLPLVVPTPRVLEYARRLHQENGLSFWDSAIIGACLDCGVETLYSEDLPGGLPPSRLRIVDPFL
jgi:predicted nucleic acid-binding protein